MKDGGPAFPPGHVTGGMTMRQYYKAKALATMGTADFTKEVAKQTAGACTPQDVFDAIAGVAGHIADAMIAEDEETAK